MELAKERRLSKCTLRAPSLRVKARSASLERTKTLRVKHHPLDAGQFPVEILNVRKALTQAGLSDSSDASEPDHGSILPCSVGADSARNASVPYATTLTHGSAKRKGNHPV
jgi:hypothetical protein